MAETSSLQSPAAGLQVIVVTPEQTVLEAATDFVALPLYDGEIGVARGHAPMIGRLGYGELRIGREGHAARYYVDGGFVQVAQNVVSVLTNRALPAAKVSEAAAKGSLEAAVAMKASGDEALSLRDRAQAQARAQLRMARGTR